MKSAPEISRNILNEALETGARAFHGSGSLIHAIDTAVQAIRVKQSLSMLEEARLREWLQSELPAFARKKNAKPPASEPLRDDPAGELYQMLEPNRFSPVGKPPFIFPPLWLYRLIDGRTSHRLPKPLLLRRKIIAVSAGMTFALAGLFPPWIQTFDLNTTHTRTDAGYAFIASPPQPKEYSFSIGIEMDTRRLLVELACILAVSIAAWFLFGGEKERPGDL